MKVDYVKSSNYAEINDKYSTDGNPPEDVDMNHSTGNYIEKDSKFGNVQLSGAEKQLLQEFVSDDISYDNDEMKKTGEAQIETEGMEEKGSTNIDNKVIVAGGAAGVAGAAIGGMIHLVLSSITGTATKASTSAGVPFMATVAGALCYAAAASTKSGVDKFEPQFKLRTDTSNKAQATNGIIDAQSDKTVNTINSMYSDIDEYTSRSEAKVEEGEANIKSVEDLQMEIMELEAAGMKKEAKEKKKELKELQTAIQESGEGTEEELKGITERLEIYSGENAEALGVVASATTVADFLKAGEEMRAIGRKCLDPLKAIEYIMYGLALTVVIVAATKTDWLSKPFALACAAAGAVMMAGAGKKMAEAHKNLQTKVDQEAACAKNGVDMATNHIDVLSGVIEESEATIPTTGDEFGVISEESNKEIEDMQKDSEKNLNEQADSIAEDKAAYTAEDNTSAVFNALLGNGQKAEATPVVAETPEPEFEPEPEDEAA